MSDMVPSCTVHLVADNLVLLTDDDVEGYASVTNAADWVIRQLTHHKILDKRRVFYKDSTGRFDELKHDGERFAGFAAVADKRQLFFQNMLDDVADMGWDTYNLTKAYEELRDHNRKMRMRKSWVPCAEQMPTEADVDSEGKFWTGHVTEGWVELADLESDFGRATHWKRTGLRRPEPPTPESP